MRVTKQSNPEQHAQRLVRFGAPLIRRFLAKLRPRGGDDDFARFLAVEPVGGIAGFGGSASWLPSAGAVVGAPPHCWQASSGTRAHHITDFSCWSLDIFPENRQFP
jgi:hypothetical protein